MADSGVVMKGGTSGNRENALAPVPGSGDAQPVLDTASDKSYPDIQYPEKRGTHPFDQGTPDFLPDCGTIPGGSPDVADPEA